MSKGLKKFKLATDKAIALHAALTALDGKPKMMRGSDGVERAEREPYAFDGDRTYLYIALNLDALAGIRKAYLKAYNDAVRVFNTARAQIIGDDGKVKPTEVAAEAQLSDEHQARIDGAGELEVEVQLYPLELPHLKPKENRIPPTVIAGLMPILTRLEVSGE